MGQIAKADCPVCQGTGWAVSEQDGISEASRCACVAQIAPTRLEEEAQIPPNFRQASFDNFVLPPDNPTARRGLSDVMLVVLAYANKYPAVKKPGLLLVGETGTGKTHLAVAVLRTLITRGHAGMFFDYLNLLDRIRSSYNATLGTADREAFTSAIEAEILVLDDLGAHRAKDFVEDTVTSLITYRYNHRKPLIATTNLTDPAITGSVMEKTAPGVNPSAKETLEQRIGERSRSRLFEMCQVIRMPGVADYRMKPMK